MINRRQFLVASSLLPLAQYNYAKPKSHYDAEVAIIGSGPVGLSLATQLVNQGINTIVIESGALDGFSERAQARNKVLDAGYGLPYPLDFATKRMAGGTSNVWGGHTPRFLPDDLVTQSKFGYGQDWPITYNELSDYYCKAEKLLNIFNVLTACNNTKINDTSHQLAKHLEALQFEKSVPASVTVNLDNAYTPLRMRNTHLPVLLKGKNFQILPQVTARDVVIDKKGKIKSVLCTNDEGNDIEVKCKATVICCGAIQSARLLQLINQKNQQNFGNETGQLGANFMDHPAMIVSALYRSPTIESTGFGQSQVFGWYGRYRKIGVGAYMPLVAQYPAAKTVDGISTPLDDAVVLKLSVTTEQLPVSTNRLELSDTEKDEFGDALPKIWYKPSEFDKRTLTHASRNIQHHIGKIKELQQMNKPETHLGRHHLMGTARMATSDKTGVVDENLKVYGTKNLYIAGGSNFPTGGAANPTLTAVALAIRLGEHLATI